MSLRAAMLATLDDLRAILASSLIRAALSVHSETALTLMGYVPDTPAPTAPPFSPADQVRNAVRAVAEDARERDIRLAATLEALAARGDDRALLKLAALLKA